MGQRSNFADASFEPSDDQLNELMKEAFAGVNEASERALQRLRDDIERQRKMSLADLAKLVAKHAGKP